MHEFSITQSILDIALRHGEKAGASRIKRLNLVVGELSSVIDDSVQFYWDIVARDTIAEGSELAFERVPGKLRCLKCGEVFRISSRAYVCPVCGEHEVVVAGGDEFRLASIEIE
jgi:hydrogenase nickel incorporation protein HypA/HybF